MLSDVGDLLEVHDLPVLLDGPAGRRSAPACGNHLREPCMITRPFSPCQG
jgi:hypothetical protein